jgi:hypothetical protein
MEPIDGSETSAISNQTPGKHPKENLLHVKQGESLKLRKFQFGFQLDEFFLTSYSKFKWLANCDAPNMLVKAGNPRRLLRPRHAYAAS